MERKSIIKTLFAVVCLALLATTFSGCKAKKEAEKDSAQKQTTQPKNDAAVQGILKNMTGLDGCKWLIELTNGNKLQPTNLADFNIALEDGKPVTVDYVAQPGVMSTCMAGKVVKIITIKER